eukprot:2420202-Rhodomonas_salina.1
MWMPSSAMRSAQCLSECFFGRFLKCSISFASFLRYSDLSSCARTKKRKEKKKKKRTSTLSNGLPAVSQRTHARHNQEHAALPSTQTGSGPLTRRAHLGDGVAEDLEAAHVVQEQRALDEVCGRVVHKV